jgi:pilus assembly protein Flp/PilA
MLRFAIILQNFLAEPVRRNDRGATAIEYGLIVTLIAVVIVGVVAAIGNMLNIRFGQVLGAL